ncbi:MAG: sugar transferase [Candidatus Gracilibacteria bacterium]|jgi:exopolysaccharide biosynthesis polyprenyl glycosylphosphotransferase
MKRSEIAFGLLRIPIDFLMTLFAFLLAYRIRAIVDLIPGIHLPLDLESFPSLDQYVQFSITGALALVALFALNKMYSLKSTTGKGRELGQVIITTIIWLMLIIAYFFLTRTFPFSRLALIYTWVLTILLISVGRLFIRMLQHFILLAGIGKKRIVFVGDNEISQKLYKMLKKDSSYVCLGVIDEHENPKYELPSLGSLKDLAQIVKNHEVEEIIQTKSDLKKEEATQLLEFCRENHLSFSFVPSLLEVQQTNVETIAMAGIPVIKLKPTALDGWSKIIKRIFDIFGGIIGLIIFSPIFLVIAIAIKLDSKGTIFFKFLDDGSRVKRVGEHGRLFYFYKFRTMHPKTHNLRYTELAKQNTRSDSPLVKIKNDPRVTKVGKFLRKTSLDELPQLLNVLKGEMSLVGPRPHLPEEVAKYQKRHRFVLTIKPGITGLAQISGRSDLNFEEEIRLDTFYIEHWSLWLDIKIILKTFLIPFKRYEE